MENRDDKGSTKHFCSTWLSYRPPVMDLTGFEPAARIVNSDVVPSAFVTLFVFVLSCLRAMATRVTRPAPD